MQTHADHIQNQPANGTANTVSAQQEKASADSVYQPGTILLKKDPDADTGNDAGPANPYQAMADNSAQVKQGMQLQAMANSSVSVQKAAQLQAMVNHTTGPGEKGAAPGNGVAQLTKYTKKSSRIATYRHEQARAERGRRFGRNNAIVRYVPNFVPTFVANVAGTAAVGGLGGGRGLFCPVGSYLRKRNNFNYTGSRAGDVAALGGPPAAGMVWHHHHNFQSTGPNSGTGTMLLLPVAAHARNHRGGVWQWNHTPGNAVYG